MIGYGVSLIWRGLTEGYREHLEAEGKSGDLGQAYLLLGKVGYVAKGVAHRHRRRAVRLGSR